MNPVLTRFVLTSPVWLPMLACASMLDFLFFPYSRKIGCAPSEDIARAAWKVAGV